MSNLSRWNTEIRKARAALVILWVNGQCSKSYLHERRDKPLVSSYVRYRFPLYQNISQLDFSYTNNLRSSYHFHRLTESHKSERSPRKSKKVTSIEILAMLQYLKTEVKMEFILFWVIKGCNDA